MKIRIYDIIVWKDLKSELKICKIKQIAVVVSI